MLSSTRDKLGLWGALVLAVAHVALADATIYDALDRLTPNVTRTVNTPGYNVAEKFPGSELDWDLSIQLFADVPGQVPGKDDRYVAATHFFWDPPESIPRESNGSVDVDSKFYYCISPLKYTDPEVKDDESVNPKCTGVVSDSCLKDLQKLIDADSWCAISSWPDSCMKHSEDNAELHMYGQVNITETPNSLVAFPSSPGGHKKGDSKDFADAMKTVWVVMTGFAEATSGGKLAKNSDTKLKSGISCIRGSSASSTTSAGNSAVGLLPAAVSLALSFAAMNFWLSWRG